MVQPQWHAKPQPTLFSTLAQARTHAETLHGGVVQIVAHRLDEPTRPARLVGRWVPRKDPSGEWVYAWEL